jgi:Second Messenger Oligonucleotide or Dinucleotide Synthetase domain
LPALNDATSLRYSDGTELPARKIAVFCESQFDAFDAKLILDDTRRNRIESAYGRFVNFCKSDGELSVAMKGEPFFQGSYSYGTIIRPLRELEFDVDVIYPFSLKVFNANTSPHQVLNWFAGRLRQSDDYKQRLINKPRCIRLDYASDFHLDIIPSTDELQNRQPLAVPTRDAVGWIANDPVGIAKWVGILDDKSMLSDLHSEFRFRRAVRMLKRWRDEAFSPQDAPSSILLLTILGKHEPTGRYSPPLQNPLFPRFSNDASYIFDMLALSHDCLQRSGHQSFLHPTLVSDNLASAWTAAQVRNFLDALATALNNLGEAMKSDTEAVSISYYKRVFGATFPL